MRKFNVPITWSTEVTGTVHGGDCSATSITGTVTCLDGLSRISYQYRWTGTPTGALGWQVSNDYDDLIQSGNWVTLDTSLVAGYSTINPAGSASSSAIDLQGIGYRYIRPTYTRTSGTGALYTTANGSE